MGLIGKLLNRVCEDRPDLARGVLTREITTLDEYIDHMNPSCGCVIGTMALEAGFVPTGPPSDTPFRNAAGTDVVDYLAARSDIDPDTLDDVGMEIARVSRRIDFGHEWRERIERASRQAERTTIHLIRQRIAVRLAMAGAV